jgi:2'-hydroxyisoflavone reductase
MLMHILVLGGTVFLGRHLVAALQARGHAVTVFNRGRSAPDAFAPASSAAGTPGASGTPGTAGAVEQLRGDRDGGLDALLGRRWDAVVDCCGYVPRVVGASAALLREAVGRYAFISSISVYSDFTRPGTDEQAPVAQLDDPANEDVMANYGALKAACERAVEREFGHRTLVVRPGLIVGPLDPTGRFTYWVERAERGGEILAPAPHDAPVQFIDARDLAAWIVALLEGDTGGTFNATNDGVSMGELIETCAGAAGAAASATWVDPDFLLAREVAPWTGVPLWVTAEDAGVHQVSVERAQAARLRWRPVADTVRDTLAWSRQVRAAGGATAAPRYAHIGLPPARETALLEAWREFGARAGRPVSGH